MDIETATDGTAATLSLTGHLNTNTARDLETAIDNLPEGITTLIIDMAALDYISSAGLRVIVGTYKRLMKTGGTLTLHNLCDDVREVFDITGLADLLDIE